MAFIQIIEFRTDDIDGFSKLGDEWEAATEGERTTQRAVIARDRNNPDRYFNIVFFDSYESAMTNSNLPATAAFAEKLQTKVKGEPTFHDLDVVEDRS
jgi:quinol monooxygenase YgiN